MAVRFLEDTPMGAVYRAGDVAGFDAATEARLIKGRHAEPARPRRAKAAR